MTFQVFTRTAKHIFLSLFPLIAAVNHLLEMSLMTNSAATIEDNFVDCILLLFDLKV